MRALSKRQRFFLTVAVLVAAGGFFAFAHARPMSRFGEVSVGMSRAQVVEIMGEPLGVRRERAQRTVLYYGGFQRGRWCTMEVFLSGDDTVNAKFHDH